MTNPMFNPQPNYSGVTIQIANPAVNVSRSDYDPRTNRTSVCGGYANYNSSLGVNGANYQVINGMTPQRQLAQDANYIAYPQESYSSYPQPMNSEHAYGNYGGTNQISGGNGFQQASSANGITNPVTTQPNTSAYPAQYYLNNYNYGVNGNGNGGIGQPDGNISRQVSENYNNTREANTNDNISRRLSTNGNHKFASDLSDSGQYSYGQNQTMQTSNGVNSTANQPISNSEQGVSGTLADDSSLGGGMNSYKMYADKNTPKDTDMTRSKAIIGDLDEREAEIQEEKKNTKETKIVALTDEYIKSLENYLNNPNDEIRLMASKEILTRLDEDKDRYNDAALNALLNKMLQDPSKLVRIASLSAFASQLASGNDYTVKLLHNIQSNPNADKEDVLQAADILLKMSAGVEVKNIPNPKVKENNNKV